MSKLPQEPDYSEAPVPEGASESKKRPARLRLEIPQDVVGGLEIDTEVKLTIRGNVIGIEKRESKDKEDSWANRSEVTIEDPDISLTEEQDLSDLADDD